MVVLDVISFFFLLLLFLSLFWLNYNSTYMAIQRIFLMFLQSLNIFFFLGGGGGGRRLDCRLWTEEEVSYISPNLEGEEYTTKKKKKKKEKKRINYA